ncbi:metalloprotease [Acinetobacter sp. VNK23]|uniref:metalloprotease n=1 Tax=Acinetobacter thutiue TaxID=2998078 RepID=UPI002576192B|nr:metalloprotease [Acinetobacter thutiue]MDM1019362.1 metalloprotease [Acinetobacter thutiue]
MLNKNIIPFSLAALLCISCSTSNKNYTELERYSTPPRPEENLNLPVVHVSFVFTTNNPKAREFDHTAQMMKEIQILNQYFVDENNNKIFRFKPYRYYSYQNFSKRRCDLANLLNQPQPIVTDRIPAAVKQCFPRRKHKEVLFIIYDSYTEKLKYNDITSWGFRNQGQPFILIDWERLNYQTQAATPHEMGHAFGLKHVCSPNATKKTPTNIMSSYDCGLGSGGLRNLGFNREQYSKIMESYGLLH